MRQILTAISRVAENRGRSGEQGASPEQGVQEQIPVDAAPQPDVTTRLVESEARYRAFIDNAWDLIQSVRPDGSFEFVNPS